MANTQTQLTHNESWSDPAGHTHSHTELSRNRTILSPAKLLIICHDCLSTFISVSGVPFWCQKCFKNSFGANVFLIELFHPGCFICPKLKPKSTNTDLCTKQVVQQHSVPLRLTTHSHVLTLAGHQTT